MPPIFWSILKTLGKSKSFVPPGPHKIIQHKPCQLFLPRIFTIKTSPRTEKQGSLPPHESKLTKVIFLENFLSHFVPKDMVRPPLIEPKHRITNHKSIGQKSKRSVAAFTLRAPSAGQFFDCISTCLR